MNKVYRFKRIGLLLIATFTFQLAFSQKNYVPGYVINNMGDTIFGFVESRNWVINPNAINFKTNIENDLISYKPTDIIEFKIEDEIYVSGIVDVEVTKTALGDLKKDPQLNIRVDNVFLHTLVKGTKSLYYYMNSDGRANFYIEKNSEFELLVYKRYLIRQDGQNKLTENNKYIGQLILYLDDCETISSKLNKKTKYNQSSMINLFQYYYECTSSDNLFDKKVEKVKTELGILAGVSLTSVEFISSFAFPYLVNTDFGSSYNPTAGFYFNLRLPSYLKKFSLNNEVLLTTYKFNGTYFKEENEDYYSITTLELGSSQFKINTYLRFTYPLGNCSLFLNAGISNGIIISSTNYKKEKLKFYTTSRVKEGLALDNIRSHELGYLFGTGVKYDRFSLEVRYEKGYGMSNHVYLGSPTKRIYCLLGYTL